MSKTLKITNDPEHKWRLRFESVYVGTCDADKLSKLLKKHDLLWCHDYLLMGYYFYLPSKVKGFEQMTAGETYYVHTKIGKQMKKNGEYNMIGEIWQIRLSRRLREGKTLE